MSSTVTKPSPLGRGLSALFGDADASFQPKSAAQSAPASNATRGMRRMPLTWLEPGAFQPRRHFDEEALRGLAESIKERGILEPLLVRPLEGRDRCEIVAGERRWRAAQLAGLHDVPVIVRDMSDREALEFGLIENVQRQDLSPLEEAEGYKRLMDDFSHSLDGLAKIIGKSRPHISNMLRILGLPDGVKQMITDGKLSLGHARAIVPASDQLALAQDIVRKGLNVRQAEVLAKRAAGNPEIHKPRTSSRDADTLALEKDIERALGLKVKIEMKGQSGAGSLTISFHGLEQLEGIIGKLRKD